MEIKPIGIIENGFTSKFGIPRQSGLCDAVSFVIINKEYSIKEAFRGIESFSHLWLIWEFSEFSSNEWTPTVRPPRLGGNKRVGVFSTRSPNRPNSLGLSSVRLLDVSEGREGRVILKVSGADIMNGTPIYDIKPYIAYTDSHPDALCGFADDFANYKINVVFSKDFENPLSKDENEEIILILSNDPKPSYQNDSSRIYGMTYFDYEIRFKYTENSIVIIDVFKIN